MEVLPKPILPADRGLGGKLEVRTIPRGGCGKALMLIVFRIVLPATFTPGVDLNFGRVFCKDALKSGVPPEGARSPLFGKGVENPLESGIVGIAPMLFLVLVVGNAGKADVGGP